MVIDLDIGMPISLLSLICDHCWILVLSNLLDDHFVLYSYTTRFSMLQSVV